jgi:FAD/FMN-containing dehydrogenase
MTTTINASDPVVAILNPADPDYDRARIAWDLAVDQRPAAVALPRTAFELAAAVRWAAAAGMRVTVQGTGHNAAPLGSLADTLLIRTSNMREVTIDPAAQLARVAAGAVWSDVVGPAAAHGLIPLAGSAHDVGVVGYSLGGGMSWLARRYGLSADSVVAAEVVTADGRLRRVDAGREPELFWALRGGGGDFAAVTALEIRLYPFHDVTAGVLFFPLERSAEVLDVWRRWVPGLPDEIMSCGRLLRFPPLPDIPEPLRGGAFAAIEIVHLAAASATADLIAPLRALGPVMDTVASATPADILALHMDPPGPVPCLGDGRMLTELPDAAVAELMKVAGPDEASPLLSVEIRQLGGALTRRTADAGALGFFDGNFMLFAVGLVPDVATGEVVRDAVASVLAAVEPWRAPRDYLNFRGTQDAPSRFFSEDTLRRLRAVKIAFDPTNLFRSNHPLSGR